ncbi:hypothetical protein HDV05_000974 [Chytridiales sp. JEL 0842]|nr:hypothetical protein HDV05_000974 [Chytridiales sp. JEL 0842]
MLGGQKSTSLVETQPGSTLKSPLHHPTHPPETLESIESPQNPTSTDSDLQTAAQLGLLLLKQIQILSEAYNNLRESTCSTLLPSAEELLRGQGVWEGLNVPNEPPPLETIENETIQEPVVVTPHQTLTRFFGTVLKSTVFPNLSSTKKKQQGRGKSRPGIRDVFQLPTHQPQKQDEEGYTDLLEAQVTRLQSEMTSLETLLRNERRRFERELGGVKRELGWEVEVLRGLLVSREREMAEVVASNELDKLEGKEIETGLRLRRIDGEMGKRDGEVFLESRFGTLSTISQVGMSMDSSVISTTENSLCTPALPTMSQPPLLPTATDPIDNNNNLIISELENHIQDLQNHLEILRAENEDLKQALGIHIGFGTLSKNPFSNPPKNTNLPTSWPSSPSRLRKTPTSPPLPKPPQNKIQVPSLRFKHPLIIDRAVGTCYGNFAPSPNAKSEGVWLTSRPFAEGHVVPGLFLGSGDSLRVFNGEGGQRFEERRDLRKSELRPSNMLLLQPSSEDDEDDGVYDVEFDGNGSGLLDEIIDYMKALNNEEMYGDTDPTLKYQKRLSVRKQAFK